MTPQQRKRPDFIVVEKRFIDSDEWIGVDLANSKELWRTWSLTAEACAVACQNEYPEAVLVAVSTHVEKGERL